ncbi:MAG: peptidoglycan-binding domain-containing protein [Caldimonas sp.]
MLKSFGRDERSSWRELAPMWGTAAGADGDACSAAARQRLRCSKFAATLPMLRSLDRPGFVNVRNDGGKTVSVVLVGLGSSTATLLADGRRTTVALAPLAKAWQGDFGTLWRLPDGYATAIAEGASGPLVDRLATQLATLAGEPAPTGPQSMDAALRAKVSRFQSKHGLNPVGKAGPTTFMQINRATGVDEPRLGADGPST